MAKRTTALVKKSHTGWLTNLDPLLQEEEFSGGVRVLDESWKDVKNCLIDPFGTVIKRRGGQHKSAYAIGDPTPITLVYQYWTALGSSFLLAYAYAASATSADIYEWSSSGGGTWTAKGGAAINCWEGDINSRPFACVFQDTFIITNGTDTPCYWPGSGSFTEMPSAAGECKFVKPFRNYLIFGSVTDAGGTTFHSRIKWSEVGVFKNNADWPVTYVMDLDPDDGDVITGMEVQGDYLVVFKEKKIYIVYYVGPPWIFDYKVLVVGRGCDAGTSIVNVYNELYFSSGDGFYSLLGDKLTELTEKIRDKFQNITPDYRKFIVAKPLEEMHQVWFTVPYDGEDSIASEEPSDARPCNEVWVYDIRMKYWTRYDMQLACLAVWDDTVDLKIGDLKQTIDSYDWAWDARFGGAATMQIIGGDYRGFVSDLNKGSQDASSYKSASTTDIDAWVRSQWFDLGDPTDTKRIYRTIFMIAPQGSTAYNLDVVYRLDWNEESAGTAKTVDLSGSTQLVTKEKRIDWTTQFRAIQIEYGTSLAGQPFGVRQVGFEYQRKGKTGIPSYG